MTPERDPWADLPSMPTADLLAALGRYQFSDALGHPLACCAEYVELVRRLPPLDVAAQEAQEAA